MKEKITIKNNSKETLVGVLEAVGSDVVVILCHGFQSSKDDKTLVTLASALASEGISSFRFDFSGNGESEGQFLYGNYWKEAEDLRVVVQYFRVKGSIVNTVIGHSKGGNAVLLYTSKYKDVDVVVSLSARFALNRGMQGRLGKDFRNVISNQGFVDVKDRSGRVLYRVTKESLLDRLSTDMKSASIGIPEKTSLLSGLAPLPQLARSSTQARSSAAHSAHLRRLSQSAPYTRRLSPLHTHEGQPPHSRRPTQSFNAKFQLSTSLYSLLSRVLIIHGTEDEMVPVEDAFEFGKLIKNHSLCIIDEADHNYTRHQGYLKTLILNFIKSSWEASLTAPDTEMNCPKQKDALPSRL